MIKYLWIALLVLSGAFAEEAIERDRDIERDLQDCYNNTYLLDRNNRFPHTLNTFISILRKIETNVSNVDIGQLAIAITHKFRQDGIMKSRDVQQIPGILPYVSYKSFSAKYFKLIRLLPQKRAENDRLIHPNVLTDIEKCTFHFMLSSSIEIFKRDNERCGFTENTYRRNARSVSNNRSVDASFNVHDVETLTPEQIDIITNRKGKGRHEIDPNLFYPALPPNHPARAQMKELSDCPVENGVIRTNSGPVFIGAVIAGIAAGLQPQSVKLLEFEPILKKTLEGNPLANSMVDNKWFATVAADLAEVALRQGPKGKELIMGVSGSWNSSLPRWYFLNSAEGLELTAAEIRGGLDGLIIANKIENLYGAVPVLKLSQILDLYYGNRGLYELEACNRRKSLLKDITTTLSTQTNLAAFLLKESIQQVTINDNLIKNLAEETVNNLTKHISSSWREDSCIFRKKENFSDNIYFSTDLIIIVDTTWNFEELQSLLSNLLDNMELNPYNSVVTIINAYDGTIILNTTDNILDFYSNVTKSNYEKLRKGFDFAKSIDKSYELQIQKLNDERNEHFHGRSHVILIVPYRTIDLSSDEAYCIEKLAVMREKTPDATILVWSYGDHQKWARFVRDETDLFPISTSDMHRISQTTIQLISRIKHIPQRLVNTQCGADYVPVGDSHKFTGYIPPSMFTFYRMHPNYFFSRTSTIEIEEFGSGNLTICKSHRPMNVNSIRDKDISCETIMKNIHTIQLSCGEAPLIMRCNPVYIMLFAGNSSTPLTTHCDRGTKVCKYPDMIKYTVSYKNLICVSSADTNTLNIIVLIISLICSFVICKVRK